MKTPAPGELTDLTADSIAGVIASLDRIIAWSKANRSRLGYFAALYRRVTIRVQRGIERGEFEDGPRMERLDVAFANRYLAAVEQYGRGELPTRSWQLAFDTAGRWRPIVLQHLMVGMNAHIDLDLGIAAAECVETGRVGEMKRDFKRINTLLIEMIDAVQLQLARVWPVFRVIDLMAGRLDESLAGLGMRLTRGYAWDVAESLSPLSTDERRERIAALDETVTGMGQTLLYSGVLLWILLLLIRVTEVRSVPRVIDILNEE